MSLVASHSRCCGGCPGTGPGRAHPSAAGPGGRPQSRNAHSRILNRPAYDRGGHAYPPHACTGASSPGSRPQPLAQAQTRAGVPARGRPVGHGPERHQSPAGSACPHHGTATDGLDRPRGCWGRRRPLGPPRDHRRRGRGIAARRCRGITGCGPRHRTSSEGRHVFSHADPMSGDVRKTSRLECTAARASPANGE